MRNSLAKNAVYKVVLNVFNLLVPLFVGPYVTSLLDADLYGMYNRVFSQFNVFLVIGTFGIYNYGMREISKARDNPQRVNRIYTNLFVIGVLSNLLVAIAYIIYFTRVASGIDGAVYMIMITQLVGNIFYIEFINEANENYGFITKKTIIIRLLYLVSIFVFVRKAEDIVPYTLVICLTVLANNLVSFVYLRRRLRLDFKGLNLLHHLLPLVVTLLMTNVELLYGQLDQLLLAPFINDIAVTHYTLPVTLMGMVGTIPLALISVSIPRLAKHVGDENRKAYLDTLHNTTNVYMSMIIPMALGVMVLSEEIMWLYTKGKYTDIFPVLMAAALLRIVYGYQSIITNLVMYVNGLEKQLTVFLLIFGIANLIMDVLLILLGVFSPLTALLTTGLAVLFFNTAASAYCKKKIGVRCQFFSKQIMGYGIVAALFIPIALGIKMLHLGYLWNIVLIVAVCVPLYGGYLFWKKDPVIDLILGRFLRKIKKS